MTANGLPLEADAWDVFAAALRVVEPGLVAVPLRPPVVEIRSGLQMWNWIVNASPIIERLVAALDEDQRSMVRQVLDGMLRERTSGEKEPA